MSGPQTTDEPTGSVAGKRNDTKARTLPVALRWTTIAALAGFALVLLARASDRRSLDAAAFELHETLEIKALSKYERLVEGDNAAVWLEAAGDALVGVGKLGNAVVGFESTASCAELEDSEIASILEQNHKALQVARLALDSASSSYGIRYRQGHAAEIPNLTRQLQLSRLLVLGGRLQLCQGDVESAMQSTRLLRQLRDALYAEPLPIFRLLGVAVGNRYLWLARQWLLFDATPEDFLDELTSTSPPEDLKAQIDETLSLEALVAINLPVVAFGPYPAEGFDVRSWIQPRRRKTQSLNVQRERLQSLRASDDFDLEALQVADDWFEASHIGERMALDHARRQLLRAAAQMRLGRQPAEVSQTNAFTKQPLRVEFTATPPSIVIPDGEERVQQVIRELDQQSHLRQVTSLPIAPAFE